MRPGALLAVALLAAAPARGARGRQRGGRGASGGAARSRVSTSRRSTGRPGPARGRPCAGSRPRTGLTADGVAGAATQGALGRRGRPVLRQPHDQARRRRVGRGGAPVPARLARVPVGDASTAASAATSRRRCGASRPTSGVAADGTAGPQTLRLLRGADPALADLAEGSDARAASATASGRAGTASTPASTIRPRRARSSRLPGAARSCSRAGTRADTETRS